MEMVYAVPTKNVNVVAAWVTVSNVKGEASQSPVVGVMRDARLDRVYVLLVEVRELDENGKAVATVIGNGLCVIGEVEVGALYIFWQLELSSFVRIIPNC